MTARHDIGIETVLELQLARAFILNKQLYAPVFARFGIETYEWHALLQLAAQDGLPQVELGRRMLRDKVTISRLVADIEAKGLVERRSDQTDTRVKRVYLTPKAHALIPRAQAAYLETARRAHRRLSRRKRDQLKALLSELQRGYRDAMASVPRRDAA